MANLTFATVKIATKEDLNNVFIFSLFRSWLLKNLFAL